jgi:transposase
MNKALPTITESPPALQRRLRAEPEAKKRQRLQALYLLASGQATTRLALAQLLAVHRHTIRAWLTLYEEGGLKALLTIHKAPGKVSRLTWPIREQLQVRLNEPQGFASYAEIRQYLAETHALALSYSAVHAFVRYKLRAKPKAPRRSHPKKSLRTSRSFNRPSRATS